MTDKLSERSAVHHTFVIEHTYRSAPAAVFAAFADREAKARWFGGPDDGNPDLQLDFRVGGKELSVGGPPGGAVYTYEALYQDIVPNQRIVSTYNMWVDDELMSVSVATVALAPAGKGTTLTYTEQAVYLDGKDAPQFREEGVRELLVDQLGKYLK